MQETRRWDAGKGRTMSMRSKEEAHDYRYVVEPDLPPIIIYDEQINKLRASIPEMPDEKREKYVNKYGINSCNLYIYSL